MSRSKIKPQCLSMLYGLFKKSHSLRVHTHTEQEHATSLFVDALCLNMYHKGYRWASLCPQPIVEMLKAGSMYFTLEQAPQEKPYHAWYFSRIETDGSLSWKEEVILNEFEIEKYASSPICFTKVHEKRLIHKDKILNFEDHSVTGVMPHGQQRSNVIKGVAPRMSWKFDWPSIRAAGYAGVLVDDLTDGWGYYGGWWAPMVAVWDVSCLHDLKFFTNSGPWTYDLNSWSPQLKTACQVPRL